jgi:hypothetical protein
VTARQCLGVAILAGVVAACGSGSGYRDSGLADGQALDGIPNSENADGGYDSAIVCPVSESGFFSETPSGTCEGTGLCAIEVHIECGPGVSFIPVVPNVYSCRCEEHQWQCTIKSGGFGIIPCADASVSD